MNHVQSRPETKLVSATSARHSQDEFAHLASDRRSAGAPVRVHPTWNSTPLDWAAAVGSGEQPSSNSAPDWLATVQTLLDHGASTDGITLSPDDPKEPSPQVAALLRRHADAHPA
jgi:hypothetical protein